MNGGYATSKYLLLNWFLTCFLEGKGERINFGFFLASGEMKEQNLDSTR